MRISFIGLTHVLPPERWTLLCRGGLSHELEMSTLDNNYSPRNRLLVPP